MNLAMIALDTFAYPYGKGPLVKGQKFNAESERDFDALKLTGRAREDDGTSDKGAITETEEVILARKEAERAEKAAAREAKKAEKLAQANSYQTRDMRAD